MITEHRRTSRTTSRMSSVPRVLLSGLLFLAALGNPVVAQSTIKQPTPGFNVFTVQQDVEIGRQSAVEAEKKLALLNDPSVNRYLNQIIQRLAAVAPGARYPYAIKAVDTPDINAFALPGGPMYVNRGLISAARSEAELAGVLAHEMSHVALRHGTHQASTAYLAQSGLGLLGGLLGKKGNAADVVNAVGGIGLNLAFLKFSRNDEYEADASGAQIMARAGYAPVAMADFFEVLRKAQGSNPSAVAQFLSDHPPAADREARIREMATSLGSVRKQDVGNFADVRARVTNTSLASSNPPPVTYPGAGGNSVSGNIAAPSQRFVAFKQPNGFFTIQQPDNWQAYPSGNAASFAPEGGVVDPGNGQAAMIYGVIVNHYAPFEGTADRQSGSLQHNYAPFEDRSAIRGTLEDATDDLVRTLLRSNAYLRATDNSAQRESIGRTAAYTVTLLGPSPVTGEDERVKVVTRSLTDNHVVYVLCVSPNRESDTMDRVCARMLRTLVVDDGAAHDRAVVGGARLEGRLR